MADTANEEFRDALIRHQIGLQRLAGTTSKKVVKLLAKTRLRLKELVTAKVNASATGQTLTPITLRRLRVLEDSVKKLRAAAIDQGYDVLREDTRDLTIYEAEFLSTVTKTVSPVLLDLILPPSPQLAALVTTQPFAGKTLKQWAANQRAVDLKRIMDAVKIGMVQGDSVQTIVSRVVAATDMTARDASTITRTAVNFYSNKAKEMVYKANSDVFSKEVFTATLDSRTTPVCRGLDGKRYDVGKGPRPPMHMNCRSVRVALIGDELIGQRPAKASTTKQLLREFANEKGFKAPSSRKDLPRGTKGDFDDFARKRIRQLTGRVPSSETYDAWLRKQSTVFQDDVLGKGKAKLFRDGLTLDKFVDRTGREFTLEELKKRDARR